MSDKPVQVTVAAFQTEQGADGALYALHAARSTGYIELENVAVLRRDEESKLHVDEKGDMTAGQGAIAGGVLGAVIGLIVGPGAILVGAAGAAVGGLAAKLRDSGFDDKRLQKLGESLTPGTSALIVMVEPKWASELEADLTAAGGEIATVEVAAEVLAEDDDA